MTKRFDLDGKTGLDWGLSGVPETYLIDGEGIVRRHYRGPITERDLNETILPFYGTLHQRPLSPGLPGSLPNPGYALDPEFAKAQLAEAGYPDGFKTSIRVLADSPFVNVATAIQASLAQGGIDAQIITGNGDQTYGAMRDRNFELVVGRGGDRTRLIHARDADGRYRHRRRRGCIGFHRLDRRRSGDRRDRGLLPAGRRRHQLGQFGDKVVGFIGRIRHLLRSRWRH